MKQPASLLGELAPRHLTMLVVPFLPTHMLHKCQHDISALVCLPSDSRDAQTKCHIGHPQAQYIISVLHCTQGSSPPVLSHKNVVCKDSEHSSPLLCSRCLSVMCRRILCCHLVMSNCYAAGGGVMMSRVFQRTRPSSFLQTTTSGAGPWQPSHPQQVHTLTLRHDLFALPLRCDTYLVTRTMYDDHNVMVCKQAAR